MVALRPKWKLLNSAQPPKALKNEGKKGEAAKVAKRVRKGG
jgi:hypothetical protein